MKLYQVDNLINWLQKMLQSFREIFHAIQAWLMGEDTENTWPGRIIVTGSDAQKAFNNPTTTAPAEVEAEN
jgi:hypothetical protein